MTTEIIFYINSYEFDTGWLTVPDAIPNTGEYVVLPQIKGESLVEKIVHRFVEEDEEMVQRVDIYLKNESFLQ